MRRFRSCALLRGRCIPHCVTFSLLAVVLLSAFRLMAAEGRASEAALLAGAEARIEKHRKTDAVVTVVDVAGKPVPGIEVAIEQTRHAFLFGCNIYMWGRMGNERDEAAYRERFAELFNYATLPFYWASYERQRGQPDHARIERIAGWCRDNGITTKGHPLAWNYADPPWLPDDVDEVRRLQMARIDDCVARFRGAIDRWDVVNEAAHFDRESFQKRAPKMTRMWQSAGRMEFTRECFRHARNANRQAIMLINDYRTDAAYVSVIEKLLDEGGKPMYDVIGIQSHMHGGAWTNRKIWDTCERFAKFGVPLHFTETTILSGPRGWNLSGERKRWDSTSEGEQLQAREVERVYTMLFSHPAVEALTWWDFCDRGAWQGAPAGFLRKDVSPKPAYDRLRNLIKGKWWTSRTLKTDSQGRIRFRGFLGDYRVSVGDGGKKNIVLQLTLQKNDANRFDVKLSQ